MKRLFLHYLCLLALLLGPLAAGAQQQRAATGPRFALGSAQTLLQSLQPGGTVQRGGPELVTLRVAPSLSLPGRVNYRADRPQEGQTVIGTIDGRAESSFFVRVKGNAVQGNIILKASREAYEYSADGQGRVFIAPVDINKVICLDYGTLRAQQQPAPQPGAASIGAAVANLQSLPGARGVVLLDFDGQYVSGTPWNGGNPINAAASGMSDAAIQEAWELVSEDWRPFSVNITTNEAVFNSYPKNMRMRCIFTPTNTAAPGAGGVAYISSFNWNDDTPCWVFILSGKAGGEAASHEIGHTFSLGHDGRTNPSEGYFAGHGDWAPIMGVGYYENVTQWSRGEYSYANNTEDDLAKISSATFNVGYRNDDHGNSTAAATPLGRSGSSLSGGGLIERTADQDFFSFATGGGTATFSVNTVGRHGDLDILVRLYNGSGALIGTFNNAGLNTSFSASLGAGTYYLAVDGTGAGNPATDGYSDYASLGTFSISGSAPAPAGGVATMYKDCNYTGTAVGLPVGDYTLTALQSRGILNDDISSLTINGGYQVVLFENDNFSGASLTLTASNGCLVNNALGTGNWNDKASSLRVQPAQSAFSVLLEAEAANVNNGMTAEACAEGGQNMGYVDAGDYLVWNGVNFPTTGSYTIEYRVASGGSGGTISSDLNAGSIQFGNTTIPGTGGWQNWTTVSRTVTINAGTYNFGIYAQSAGWNLNWVRITRNAAREALATQSASLTEQAPGSPSELATVELYPNPVTDRLNLRAAAGLAKARYQILDAWGQPVASGQAAASLDVTTLKPGLYTLVLTTGDQAVVTRRFLK
jgi:Carbohydrate binding module (family 6)/Secretion system C-terminal sorting domain